MRQIATLYTEKGDRPLWHDLGEYFYFPREILDVFDLHELASQPIEDHTPEWEHVIHGSSLKLWDKQVPAVEAAIAAKRGIISMSCGSGKTIIGCEIAARRKGPVICIANNASLLDQFETRAKEFLTFDGEVGRVQGKRREWDRPVVTATVQTLMRLYNSMELEHAQRFATVIFDEVHHIAADQFIKVAPMFYGARFGLTATPMRADAQELAYMAHVGPVIYENHDQDLIPSLVVVPTRMTGAGLIQAGLAEHSDDLGNYQKLIGLAARYVPRRLTYMPIIRNVWDQGRKLLILTPSLAMVSQIAEDARLVLPARYHDDVVTIKGGVHPSTRLKLMDKARIIVATSHLAEEGLDLPELDTLLIAGFRSKFEGSMRQIVGRLQRDHPGKKAPIVYLLKDSVGAMAGIACKMEKWFLKKGWSVKNGQATCTSPNARHKGQVSRTRKRFSRHTRSSVSYLTRK